MATASPILVTGAPRSGTTFLGRMLSLPRNIIYVYEPFNLEIGIEGVDRAFVYLDDTGGLRSKKYDALITELLAGRSKFKINPWREANPPLTKRLGRRLFQSGAQLQYRLDAANPLKNRYLIKDPMATFAAQYLHRNFGMQTVVIMRHPASTIASYKRLGWRYNLHELTDQPKLMERYLEPVLGGLNIEKLKPIEEWSYLWLACYTVLDAYLKQNPNMIMIRHEDLSLMPMRSFERLYDQLGLPFTAKIREHIDNHTRAGNPAGAPVGVAHALRRDSARNLELWRGIIEPDELAEIIRITKPLAHTYYPSAHWW